MAPTISEVNSVHPCNIILLRSNLILSSRLSLDRLSNLFPSGFTIRVLYAFSMSLVCCTPGSFHGSGFVSGSNI
jgi:hypothetical protein